MNRFIQPMAAEMRAETARQGLDQKTIAERSGMTAQTVGAAMRGDRVSGATIEAILAVLDRTAVVRLEPTHD